MIDNLCAIAGVKDILSKFSDQEVIALCGTVTQGLLKNKVQNRQEAIRGILTYSTDVESFLRRKLLTRNHLFEYLHEAGLKVSLPVTKDELILTISKAWARNKTRAIQVARPKNEDTSLLKLEQAKNSARNRSTTVVPSSEKRESYDNVDNNSISVQQSEITSTNPNLNIRNSMDVLHNGMCSTELESMSLKFAEWFYTLMNQNEAIGVEHFYPDASIQIRLINDAMSETEECLNNAQDVVNLLFSIKSQHNLYFNPNLNLQGTRGRMDPHGLVMLMCCGTLHINSMISGVFEQVFALARDPQSLNNWKIKNTTLILRSKNNVTGPPRLGEEMLQIQ